MSDYIEVVVLGSSPTGLYALRESSRSGYRVALVDISRGCAFQSRFVCSEDRFWGSLDQIKDWLLKIAARQEIKPVIIPTSDIFIEFVVENAKLLEKGFHISDSYSRIAGHLLDKKLFHDLCVEHSIATPGVWSVGAPSDLIGLIDVIPFPCLLKPTMIHKAREFLKGEKVIIVQSRDEFEEIVSGMPTELGGWLVQEIIPGPESEITLFGAYFDKEHKAHHSFSARKLRQYPPGFGSASLVSSVRCAETERLSELFLHNIGFHGVCGVEFKRDPRDGKLKIIEVNPRPTLWFQVTHDSGKRIVSSCIDDMSGRPMHDDRNQDENVCWKYFLKDTYSSFFYYRPPSGFLLPKPVIDLPAKRLKSSFPVFSFHDPRPAFVEPLGYLRKLWGRLK